MLTNGVFAQNDILGAAMQAAILRDEVISNNITNAETPGFKKQAVEFEAYLRKAVSDYKKTGVLNLSGTAPTVSRVDVGFSTRLDENNVDINEENIKKYQNSVIYDALTTSVIENYKLLNLVFNMK